MARFRKTTSKNNSYLQLVESYRNDKKQPATRVLANLGNISNLPEQKIEQLAASFIKALGMENKFQLNNFTAGKGYHYGSCLPAISLWNELNLEQIINNALSSKISIPVSRITLIQVANRFSDAGSKLACYRWYENSIFSQLKNFVNFPEEQSEKLHTYYRSLDYLCNVKDDIEQELYYNFQGYNMENSLIFYDLTSVYFEGEQAEMAVKGYSRDHRPDADQIVIGLIMNNDGLPIAHHVFDGNTVDKSTVAQVIDDLDKRFSIKDIIFVGDRGMLTKSNIDIVKARGNNYIMGMQRRNRKIINYLLENVRFDEQQQQSQDIIIKQISYNQLSKQFQQNYDKSVRFIICYDKKTAKLHKASRERRLLKFETLLNETVKQGTLEQLQRCYHQLKSLLARYRMTKFYDIAIEKTDAGQNDNQAPNDSYQLCVQKNDDVISLEEKLDGKFFLQTEVDDDTLEKQTVVAAYKSLQKVERAFKFTKNEIDIRPVYVRKATRIKGHVMICYLCLLIETLIEKKLIELFPEMIKTENKKKVDRKSKRNDDDGLTMITLREELDAIRLVPLFLNGKDVPNYISTSISADVKKLFSTLGIVNSSDPKYLYFKAKKQDPDKNQLMLNLA